MREILFRGKRVDNGELVYGYLCFVYIDNPQKAQLYVCSNSRGWGFYKNVAMYERRNHEMLRDRGQYLRQPGIAW